MVWLLFSNVRVSEIIDDLYSNNFLLFSIKKLIHGAISEAMVPLNRPAIPPIKAIYIGDKAFVVSKISEFN